MEPKHYQFGGGEAETVLHPIVVVILLIVIILLLLRSRRYSIPAFLFGTFLIPAGQQIVLAGVHVFAYRIILLAALLRMIRFRRSPPLAGKWNFIDTAFSLSVMFHVVAFALLYLEMAAVINQAGFVCDYIGGYLFLRYAIRDNEDIVEVIKCFAVLTVIFAVCMLREQFTGENIFGHLGGVELLSEVREGHIRSQAVFQHAILAGTFGAILMPLFVWLWKSGKARILSVAGVVASVAMVVTTACSTPLFAYGAAIVGICFWPVRKHMRLFRWGFVIALVVLQLVMKAPVWALIERVHLVAGSSNYHRFQLVDQFIRHMGDWWLLGTSSNASWGYQMFDTSNEYVAQGVTGGLFSLVFFVLTISSSFGRIGRAKRSIEGRDPQFEWLLWLLGSALFANVVAFFGISYFDQTRVAWFALLAMISAATTGRRPIALYVTKKQLVPQLSNGDMLVSAK